MVIDNYEWFVIDNNTQPVFKQKIKEGKNIGIISEAGCPGVADPGQELIAIAQEMNAQVKPLVGPNSILLALMASGMNGQHSPPTSGSISSSARSTVSAGNGRTCGSTSSGRGPRRPTCAASWPSSGWGRWSRCRASSTRTTSIACSVPPRSTCAPPTRRRWGQVVVESAAYGLPTLARDVPGLRDSIREGETGWLADTDGVDPAGVVNALVTGMRAALQELEIPGEQEAYAAGCRAWADLFSWKHMHDRVVAVVSEELAARGR